ncbi:uncharacterized protein LOC141602373 isoform X1 [Silene latifolia]|uniref:uncharacterized protein LOC141602373 isoform X1 n=1 Tax=Silene latifolia TaxID=37657 RepID=UPI003D77C555
MGKKGGKKLQAFCVNRIRPIVRVPLQNKLGSPNSVRKNDKNEENNQEISENIGNGIEKMKVPGRKIMVIVDSSSEARVALQWTLTHTVQSNDTIVLLYVTKLTNNKGKQDEEKVMPQVTPKVYEQLYSMKKTCQSRWPEVEVEVKVIEGKEKGPTIVEEARKQEISLLVLGQKKRSTTWQLLLMWAGGSGLGLVEYCIQNATCMALAVRRKSKKVGGYLITTKRQKDFWLLA